MLPWYHDHCKHHYSGLTKNVPKHFKKSIHKKKKYVFISEEDKLYITKK